eukprot:m.248686 g.248686  ORF g.248686 m.248686 type:complete len:243 (-) comp26672_c2_seq7:2008-2736(-)
MYNRQARPWVNTKSLETLSEIDFSDHVPIVLRINGGRVWETGGNNRLRVNRKKILDNTAHFANNNAFAVLAGRIDGDNTEVPDLATEVLNTTRTVVEAQFATKSVKRGRFQPLSRKTKAAIRARAAAAANLRKNPSSKALREQHSELVKEAAQLKKDDKKKSWERFTRKGAELSRGKHFRHLWSWLNAAMGKKRSVVPLTPLKRSDGSLAVSPEEVKDTWKQHYILFSSSRQVLCLLLGMLG